MNIEQFYRENYHIVFGYLFVYETNSGHRGLLDFHFPTETITDID